MIEEALMHDKMLPIAIAEFNPNLIVFIKSPTVLANDEADWSTKSPLNAYNNFPIATAVSLMRLEKPHSLSYQERTRTSVPSMTLV